MTFLLTRDVRNVKNVDVAPDNPSVSGINVKRLDSTRVFLSLILPKNGGERETSAQSDHHPKEEREISAQRFHPLS